MPYCEQNIFANILLYLYKLFWNNCCLLQMEPHCPRHQLFLTSTSAWDGEGTGHFGQTVVLGEKGKQRCWEQVDRRSRGTLGKRRKRRSRVDKQEMWRGRAGAGDGKRWRAFALIPVGRFVLWGRSWRDGQKICAHQSIFSSRSWPGIKDFNSQHHFVTSKQTWKIMSQLSGTGLQRAWKNF